MTMRTQAGSVSVSGRLFPLALAFALLPGSLPSAPPPDRANEILDRRAANRDRVEKFSFNVLQGINRPKGGQKPARVTLRFAMRLERDHGAPSSASPWRIEVDFLQPVPSSIKLERGRMWSLDRNGKWVEAKAPPPLFEHFARIAESFLGVGVAARREQFAARALRENKPASGPETTTLEFVPRGAAVGFHRMEEDVNADGIPLETRLFDGAGREIATTKVDTHRKIAGVPVVTDARTVKQTPAGQIVSTLSFLNPSVETRR